MERIHEAEHDRLIPMIDPAMHLVVTLENDNYSEEKYDVWAHYQQTVHKEDESQVPRSGFRRFLCNSPIVRQTITAADGRVMKYGSYHQCYRLDGRLVAVGVLDLIPDCVSAVYFFYHESIHKFCPGKLSALREIALAIEGGYKYWYPGFYIHSCPKMRYKMDYKPQYVLDPEALALDPVDDEVLSLMAKQSYVSLSHEAQRSDADASSDEECVKRSEVAAKASIVKQVETDKISEDMWLFDTNMPGITPLVDMYEVNLDNIGVRIGDSWPDGFYKTSDLLNWKDHDIADYGCFKSSVAELVAAVGPDMLGEIRLARRASV